MAQPKSVNYANRVNLVILDTTSYLTDKEGNQDHSNLYKIERKGKRKLKHRG